MKYIVLHDGIVGGYFIKGTTYVYFYTFESIAEMIREKNPICKSK